jgi:signal transduction histidine kinase
MIVFLVVHLVEYYYPSLVQYPFDMGKGRFIDRITAFPIPVVSIAIVIIFLKRSYVRQRRKVEEKAATIAHINEQLLEQKQQLQQSNAEKNKLLSIISHDMRAPLAHIQGYLQLLTQVEIGSTERMALERDLLTSTDQAVEMLSNLLYWSRSQMEGVTVNASAINLAATLHPTLEIEKTLAAQKQVRLQYHIGNNITVLADPDMLQLVVRNVVHNAIKFTHSGGWIHIEASTQGNECKLTIADNGMGIDAGKQKRIFSMTSGSTFGTNNEKGVGLGLPLCKEFMELQGGRIEVDSTPGEGSRFYVYVPLG